MTPGEIQKKLVEHVSYHFEGHTDRFREVGILFIKELLKSDLDRISLFVANTKIEEIRKALINDFEKGFEAHKNKLWFSKPTEKKILEAKGYSIRDEKTKHRLAAALDMTFEGFETFCREESRKQSTGILSISSPKNISEKWFTFYAKLIQRQAKDAQLDRFIGEYLAFSEKTSFGSTNKDKGAKFEMGCDHYIIYREPRTNRLVFKITQYGPKESYEGICVYISKHLVLLGIRNKEGLEVESVYNILTTKDTAFATDATYLNGTEATYNLYFQPHARKIVLYRISDGVMEEYEGEKIEYQKFVGESHISIIVRYLREGRRAILANYHTNVNKVDIEELLEVLKEEKKVIGDNGLFRKDSEQIFQENKYYIYFFHSHNISLLLKGRPNYLILEVNTNNEIRLYAEELERNNKSLRGEIKNMNGNYYAFWMIYRHGEEKQRHEYGILHFDHKSSMHNKMSVLETFVVGDFINDQIAHWHGVLLEVENEAQARSFVDRKQLSNHPLKEDIKRSLFHIDRTGSTIKGCSYLESKELKSGRAFDIIQSFAGKKLLFIWKNRRSDSYSETCFWIEEPYYELKVRTHLLPNDDLNVLFENKTRIKNSYTATLHLIIIHNSFEQYFFVQYKEREGISTFTGSQNLMVGGDVVSTSEIQGFVLDEYNLDKISKNVPLKELKEKYQNNPEITAYLKTLSP